MNTYLDVIERVFSVIRGICEVCLQGRNDEIKMKCPVKACEMPKTCCGGSSYLFPLIMKEGEALDSTHCQSSS